MCRNIKTLFNFDPPATEDEIRASALQFVRKLSGFGRPSQANPSVRRAVEEVSASARASDLAAHKRAGARPRDRGREGRSGRGCGSGSRRHVAQSSYEHCPASHSTGKLSSPRNAQPPIRTGSEWSSRRPFRWAKMPGSATSATIAREANAPAQ